jgi:hypothetical protein
MIGRPERKNHVLEVEVSSGKGGEWRSCRFSIGWGIWVLAALIGGYSLREIASIAVQIAQLFR